MDALLDILKAVTVASDDDGSRWTDATRLTVIREMLRGSGYLALNGDDPPSDGLYALFGRGTLDRSKKYVVLSSHIDAVMKWFFVEQVGSKLRGTFDNAITNAAVLYNMLNGAFGDTILIAFTGNEENGMRGAKDLYRHLSGYDVIAYIVLDVSWEDYYGNVFTLENIKLPQEGFRKLCAAATMTGKKYLVVTPFAGDDEAEVYRRHACFGYYIPIDREDEMHTAQGVDTTVEMFEGYTQAMPVIAGCLLGGTDSLT